MRRITILPYNNWGCVAEHKMPQSSWRLICYRRFEYRHCCPWIVKRLLDEIYQLWRFTSVYQDGVCLPKRGVSLPTDLTAQLLNHRFCFPFSYSLYCPLRPQVYLQISFCFDINLSKELRYERGNVHYVCIYYSILKGSQKLAFPFLLSQKSGRAILDHHHRCHFLPYFLG